MKEEESRVLGCTHIPALPGYAVAGLTYPDREEIYLEPIIGWVLITRQYGRDEENPLTTITPVTLEGNQEDNAPVVYPDGTVRIANDCMFPNLERWKEYETSRE